VCYVLRLVSRSRSVAAVDTDRWSACVVVKEEGDDGSGPWRGSAPIILPLLLTTARTWTMESEMTFVGPEGVYSLWEEHKPTGHTINANVHLVPTRVSCALVRFPPVRSSAGLGSLLAGAAKRERDKDVKKDADGQSASSDDTDGSPDLPSESTGGADAGPGLFSSPAPGAARKKGASRPKHNMRTTSSTFITRLHTAEGLTRTLQAKTGEVAFLFYNAAKSFFWTEAGSKLKVSGPLFMLILRPIVCTQEPYARITFTSYPTCHDVNPNTISPERIDVIIGFNTGDLVWFGP
jgi:hypothetical protein